MTARELATFASSRSLRFDERDILWLWHVGLLRADLVTSERRLRRAGLVRCGTDDDGQRLYADTRQPHRPQRGWNTARPILRPRMSGIEPLFHRFRYYVLYHLDRALAFHLSAVRALTLSPGTRGRAAIRPSFAVHHKWMQSDDFLGAVDRWNDEAGLAIAIEPAMYQRVFGALTIRDTPGANRRGKDPREAFEVLHDQIDQHTAEVTPILQRIGESRLGQLWSDLCVDTQRLDPNIDVATLLRLGFREKRLDIEGRLGGAVLMRTMAEMIRRLTERVFDIQWPEEDERGLVFMFAPDKERLYGAQRLLDGDWRVADEFAREYGLRYGHDLRWYVEGYTEYHSLTSFFTRLGATDITVVNLLGEVAERGGRGLAFRRSLHADIQARIFSFVTIDDDVLKNVKVLRKAAEDDDICGAFFLSKPDFELANFERSELEESVWAIALRRGANLADREHLVASIAGWSSVDDLLKRAGRAVSALAGLSKGEPRWGQTLIEYAWQYPIWRRSEQRPVIEAIHMAFWTRGENYHITRRDYRVDSRTGRPVQRERV